MAFPKLTSTVSLLLLAWSGGRAHAVSLSKTLTEPGIEIRCANGTGEQAYYRIFSRSNRVDSIDRRGRWEKLCDAKDNVTISAGGVTLTKTCMINAHEFRFSYRSVDGKGDLIRRFVIIDRSNGAFRYESYFRGMDISNTQGQGFCRTSSPGHASATMRTQTSTK